MNIQNKFIAAIIFVCVTGLITINQACPNLDNYEMLSATCSQCGTVYSYTSTPDGKADAHTCVEINSSDSLIADETWICTDTDSLGFTFNKEVAELIDAQPGCTVVARDGDYYWFTYTQPFHICNNIYHDGCDAECGCTGATCHKHTHKCVDPTHAACDGACECDGMECNLKSTKL
jgi:hypothetical protein